MYFGVGRIVGETMQHWRMSTYLAEQPGQIRRPKQTLEVMRGHQVSESLDLGFPVVRVSTARNGRHGRARFLSVIVELLGQSRS